MRILTSKCLHAHLHGTSFSNSMPDATSEESVAVVTYKVRKRKRMLRCISSESIPAIVVHADHGVVVVTISHSFL